jgi:drug/metabolite transporter (DMT)-like permease
MKDKKELRYFSPMIVIIVTIVIYNLITKEIPGDINTFASLVITYSVSAICCFLLFMFNSKERNFIAQVKKTNWASWLYGLALVTTEAGYVYVYRAGWSVSLGSLVVNIILACLMMFVGWMFYKERISIRQFGGLGVCILGMVLINS